MMERTPESAPVGRCAARPRLSSCSSSGPDMSPLWDKVHGDDLTSGTSGAAISPAAISLRCALSPPTVHMHSAQAGNPSRAVLKKKKKKRFFKQKEKPLCASPASKIHRAPPPLTPTRQPARGRAFRLQKR